MKLKRDTKFAEESNCRFKIDITNIDEFWPEHWKVSNMFTLMGSFEQSLYWLSQKSTEE